MSKKKDAPAASAPPEIHVLNGPNLNMLGFREPEVYGHETLTDLEKKLRDAVKESGLKVKIRFFQTNYEGEMLDYIHSLVLGLAQKGGLGGILINPAAWTHTSIAIRDAVMMLKPVPIVEVHLSNPLEREEFRHHSVIEDLADYRIAGMGQDGYLEGLRWLLSEMQKERLDVH
ncbi:MAG: 3-dehydroquinate dehydratase [Deltaproteobacteria bacterium]|nr:3-dehydroquinate dehydratase [Deltaproteobacteria bacterium]